jgi:hypothetical protein
LFEAVRTLMIVLVTTASGIELRQAQRKSAARSSKDHAHPDRIVHTDLWQTALHDWRNALTELPELGNNLDKAARSPRHTSMKACG